MVDGKNDNDDGITTTPNEFLKFVSNTFSCQHTHTHILTENRALRWRLNNVRVYKYIVVSRRGHSSNTKWNETMATIKSYKRQGMFFSSYGINKCVNVFMRAAVQHMHIAKLYLRKYEKIPLKRLSEFMWQQRAKPFNISWI